MANPKLYKYENNLLTTKELCDTFGVSYCRMNNLIRKFDGNIDRIEEYYKSKVESSKGAAPKKIDTGSNAEWKKQGLMTDSETGPFMTIAEIADVTGMSRAAISRRVKMGMTGADLMKKKGEKKVTVKASKATEKATVKRAVAEVKKVQEKAAEPTLSPDVFIKQLEQERDEYLKSRPTPQEFIPSREDVAEVERVFGKEVLPPMTDWK